MHVHVGDVVGGMAHPQSAPPGLYRPRISASPDEHLGGRAAAKLDAVTPAGRLNVTPVPANCLCPVAFQELAASCLPAVHKSLGSSSPTFHAHEHRMVCGSTRATGLSAPMGDAS